MHILPAVPCIFTSVADRNDMFILPGLQSEGRQIENTFVPAANGTCFHSVQSGSLLTQDSRTPRCVSLHLPSSVDSGVIADRRTLALSSRRWNRSGEERPDPPLQPLDGGRPTTSGPRTADRPASMWHRLQPRAGRRYSHLPER